MFNSELNNTLTYVKEGMDVYDLNNEKVGTVRIVQIGDENPNSPVTETVTGATPRMRDDSLIEEVAESIFATDDFPQQIRNHMRRYGYIRIDAGILRADMYASGDQVASVGDGRVELNVSAEDLHYR
jgi:hypothetical protein